MEEIIRKRKIHSLYHFTQTENLGSIFRYGIVPRETLEKCKIESHYNDDFRYDNCRNAVCTSIEFPNYKMFFCLRQKNSSIKWVVIELDANILCNFECAFCWTNAGDKTMYNQSIEQRMGKMAFQKLFENRQGYPQRENLEIPDSYPTNPQAEVLVFDIISADYIKSLYFEDSAVMQMFQHIIPDKISVSVNKNYFAPRKDFGLWK